MAELSPSEIYALLDPYYPSPASELVEKLSVYLDLLLRWNARTNLTAIREPREIVQRHFGESLFVARHLPESTTLLDLGSGAGFPGLPIQLAFPKLKVTLAESQHKKAAFLAEAVRTLGVDAEVWGGRVEELPEERRFGVVALRAVDRPVIALELAHMRLSPSGVIAWLTNRRDDERGVDREFAVPNSESGVLRMISSGVLPGK